MHREPLEDGVPRLALDPELGEELAVEVGVPQPDHGTGQPGRVERRLQHLDHLGGPLRRRASRSAPPRPARTRASGRAAGAPPGRRWRDSRGAAAARRSRSGWRPGGRSAPSCPSAAPAGRRARRRSGRRRWRSARRRAPAPRRTRSRASTPRRSHGSRTPRSGRGGGGEAPASRRGARRACRGGSGGSFAGPYERGRESPATRGPRQRPVQSGRRAHAAARRSARSHDRSGGCCRSPRCRRPPARR